MARRSCGSSSSSCAICEQSNLPSICSGCVNYRLNGYGASSKTLKSERDSLYARLNLELSAKAKPHEQLNWRICQNEKLTRLKERLRHLEEQLAQGKTKVNKMSQDLKSRESLLESVFSMLERNHVELLEKSYPNLICTQSLGHMAITSERLHKQSVVIKQICKLFPLRPVNSDGEKKDTTSPFYQICNARLPRALDPHSVPSDELSASLGYMVQLLNLLIPSLAAPVLHNSGFAGSCSRIWQRDTYWDTRPSSQSNEYPLFIHRQNICSTGENSWSDRSASNFGVASVESTRRPSLDAAGGVSFNYSSASPHTVETHKDLQKGISLLKKSVACVTAYCYDSLCLDLPSEASTFEAFAKLLATLSSSKEVRSVFSLKMARPRSGRQVPLPSKSVWHLNSVNLSGSPSSDSAHTAHLMRQHNLFHNHLSDSAASFLYAGEVIEPGKPESLVEGWDIVEHPTFPPPPSQVEDIEHWTRAMFIDATRR